MLKSNVQNFPLDAAATLAAWQQRHASAKVKADNSTAILSETTKVACAPKANRSASLIGAASARIAAASKQLAELHAAATDQINLARASMAEQDGRLAEAKRRLSVNESRFLEVKQQQNDAEERAQAAEARAEHLESLFATLKNALEATFSSQLATKSSSSEFHKSIGGGSHEIRREAA